MTIAYSRWRSIRTRVTVLALALFMVSIGATIFITGRLLRADLQVLVGQQQVSTVTIVAAEINQEVVARLRGLELVSGLITSAHLSDPATLDGFLSESPLLQELFDAGVFVTDTQGTAIASVPAALGRVGVNFMDRDHVIAAVKQGRAAVSEPVIGRQLKAPVVSMAVPIRSDDGAVVGALVGVVNLAQANFLDQILGNRYGKGGGYVLVDPKHRRIVTATDKSQSLAALPALGQNPMMDRFAQGYEGYGPYVDAQGVKYVSAAHTVAAPGWYIMALLPEQEAFAPIQAIHRKMLLMAAVLALVAGAVAAWMLGRELEPMLSTAKTLSSLKEGDSLPHALSITRPDEVGQLIGSFNYLLEVLHLRESALAESEARFRNLVGLTAEGIVVHAQGRIAFANPAAVRMMQAQSEQELLGKPLQEFIHPDFHALALARARQAVVEGIVMPSVEYTFVTCTGDLIDVEVAGAAITFNGQPASQISIHDITERKAIEKRLRQLSRITEQAPIAIVISDLVGVIEYVNPWFSEITGYSPEESIGRNPRFLQSGQTPPSVYVDLWTTLRAGGVWHGEFHNKKRNGELFVERAVIAPIQDSYGVVSQYVALKEDITVQRRHEDALQASLQEKTALLNEVHHRVKNNLQVVTSLLRLEGSRAGDGVTRAVLNEMQGRIHSMALVHETLYRSGSFASVDLQSYVRQVASAAFRAQAHTSGAVRLVLDLAPVQVSLDQATPCGLLVNELISNCIKHGFAHGERGEVKVELQPVAGNDGGPTLWCLRVRDTGAGLPPDFEERRTNSLGLQLVGDLAGQLGGKLTVEAGPGASFAITFPVTSA